MYKDSGGRNVFPLIAAHGALWASGYFRRGMLAGRILSMRYALKPQTRQAKLKALAVFADKFRDINRRVCAESYAIYFASKVDAHDEFLESLVGERFLNLLKRCHDTGAASQFSSAERAALFHEFFSWEQENIVAPAVAEAYASFDWYEVGKLALVPRIDFAYFGRGHALKFVDFADRAERIHKGLLAYQRAEAVGLDEVERGMMAYGVMPADFIANHQQYFDKLASTG